MKGREGGYGVDHLLALLQLALGTLHVLRLFVRKNEGGNVVAHSIVILASTERAAQARDLPVRLVDRDYISGTDLLLRDRVYHLPITHNTHSHL